MIYVQELTQSASPIGISCLKLGGNVAKVKTLTVFERGRIVELQHQGLSQRAIAGEIGCSKTSPHPILGGPGLGTNLCCILTELKNPSPAFFSRPAIANRFSSAIKDFNRKKFNLSIFIHVGM